LLLVPAEGEPRFVCPAFEDGTARERVGAAAPLWTWREHESPGAVAAKALAGAGKPRVAVDPPLRSFVREDLDAGLGRATVLGAALVAEVRGRKQPGELLRLQRANAATKAAIAAVAPRLRVGVRESEVRALVVAAQRAAGLSDPWALVLFGPNAAFPHGTGQERALAAGDAVLIDTGGALHGYWSDVSRTLLPAAPAPALQRAYDAVAAAQAAGIAAVREGVACGTIDAAAREVIAAAGLGAPDAVFRHRTGHGIGLEVHEAPYLVHGSRVALARGHTFSVEPGIYVPGQLGVRIEDIVAVAASGPEILGPAQSPGEPPPVWGSGSPG
jgi:Xaa-Pro dipeptidase